MVGVSVEGKGLSLPVGVVLDQKGMGRPDPEPPCPAALRVPCPAPSSSANTMFEMEWRGRRVALKASNGRYVCMKKNGQLAAISDFVGEHSPPALGELGLGSLPRDSTCSEILSPPRADPSGSPRTCCCPWQ